MPSKRVLGVIIVVTALVTSIIIVFGKEKAVPPLIWLVTLSSDKNFHSRKPNWKDEIGQLDGKHNPIRSRKKAR